jgi:hypothetical protein
LWRRADAKLPRTVAAKRIGISTAVASRGGRYAQDSRKPQLAKKK